MDTLGREENMSKIFLPLLQLGSIIKQKNLLPRKLYVIVSSWIDSLSGIWCKANMTPVKMLKFVRYTDCTGVNKI